MLKITDLNVNYGVIKAIKSLDMVIDDGEFVALIGNNGAGKSTLLNTIAGRVKSLSGEITYNENKITNKPANKITNLGITLSPEGREIFPEFTTEENLRLGAYLVKDKDKIDSSYEKVYSLFPILKERRNQVAGTLSGGEQQMLSIGRALMGDPKLLMLDEPSLGLAPKLISLIFETIMEINQNGIAILLVEQNANIALQKAERAYVLETGSITLSGQANELRKDKNVRKAYLGI